MKYKRSACAGLLFIISREMDRKTIDIFTVCDKITKICKDYMQTKQRGSLSARGKW